MDDMMMRNTGCAIWALTMQRYRIRRRISQIRFLDSALLQPVCEVGRRRIVALRDELLGGPVGKQRLDFRTVLVQLAFAGAFRPSDRQEARLARRDSFVRSEINPRSISAAIENTIAMILLWMVSSRCQLPLIADKAVQAPSEGL